MQRKFSELPAMERLAIKQGIYNALGGDVSTKSADSLRSACDAAILDNYRATGARSYDVHVNGEAVGTYSVRIGKGAEARTERRVAVTDAVELERYAREDAREEAFEYIHLCAQNFAEFLLETYGIVADGCGLVEEDIPASGPEVRGTTLRVDAERLAHAMRGYLPTSIAGLLGEEADDGEEG